MKTCVVAIERDEPNVGEWLRWHLLVCGFDRAVLFEDGGFAGIPPELEHRVCQLSVKDVPEWFQPAMARQFRCYNWYLDKMSGGDKAVAFLDLDEYLVLHGRKAGQLFPNPQGAATLAFNWVFFGSRLSDGPADSLVKRFRRRANETDKHVKVMLDLEAYRKSWQEILPVFCNPHVVHSAAQRRMIPSTAPDWEVVTGPYNEKGYDPSVWPYVAHFWAKTREEFDEKVSRGRPDHDERSPEQYYRQRAEMERLRAERDPDGDECAELVDELKAVF